MLNFGFLIQLSARHGTPNTWTLDFTQMNTMNMKFWWNTQSAHSSGHPFSDFQELQHTHFPLLIKCQCCNGTTRTWKTTRGYHSQITSQFDTSDLNPKPFSIIHLLADTSNTNKITYAPNYYFSLLLRTREIAWVVIVCLSFLIYMHYNLQEPIVHQSNVDSCQWQHKHKQPFSNQLSHKQEKKAPCYINLLLQSRVSLYSPSVSFLHTPAATHWSR